MVSVRSAWLLPVFLCMLASSNSCAAADRKPIRWILNGPAITTFTTDPTATAFFENSSPFVVAPAWRNATVPPSWHAIRTRIFGSFKQFSNAIANNRIDPAIKAVLYDNESWQLTPQEEQDNYASYAQQFAELARQHGYLVVQTPATSLAAAGQQPGERRFDAFLRMQFIADAARNADVVDIQAQGSQVPPDAFAKDVAAAAKQARDANPKVLVFAGISTNPSGHEVTADQIVAAVSATRDVVDGYWFNVPQKGPSCPNCNDFRPDMAVDVLRRLQH